MDRHEFFRLVGTQLGVVLINRCLGGCGQGGDPVPTPPTNVDFTLNLNDPVNANLLVKGGYVIANGVIVAQTSTGTYVAVAANCTHEGTQLVFKSTDNQFYCPLHQSRFGLTGNVVVGPAVIALTQYTVETNLTARTLRIHN